jgi:hypothetical protein
MVVKYLAPSKCPTTAASTIGEDPLGEEIAVLMGQMSRLRRVKLGLQDKRDFLQFYAQRNTGRVRAK